MKKQLMLVTMLSVGTALTTMGRLKPVAASLTPPTVYDYSYTWNATSSEQYLNVNGVDSIPLYTRTADGSHFDYISTFNVIDGLDVKMDFQRSNSTWQSSGTFYKPDEARIGSDNTVGTVANKFYLEYDNQTSHSFQLFIDISSSGDNWRNYIATYNNLTYVSNINQWTGSQNLPAFHANGNSIFFRFILNSYSKFIFYPWSLNGATYFDAWYLQDLGISESYQQGLDAETDGILTDYLGTDAQQIGWVLIGIAAILFAFKGGK